MANFKLIEAKDSVYALNNYLALNGLQRFQYRYTGREQDIDEIGNSAHVDTVTEPETSGSFEVTDTGGLAAILARMHFDYDTQQYVAGTAPDLATNAFSFDEEDLQWLIFDLIEQKKPGATFSEAKIIPNCYLTRFGIRLTADNVGSVTFDWSGNLLIPVYKPYHQVQSYAATFVSSSQVQLAANYGADTSTHGILGGMVNNVQLAPADLAEVAGLGNEDLVDITASGLAKIGGAVTDEDRVMIWLYHNTPTDSVDIDYPNAVTFVRPDRIDLWLSPVGDTLNDANRLLRVQSFDFSADIQRDELKEILRNETRSSTFFKAARFPLNLTGTMNIFEETLHKWAELQDKTLNESAATSSVDENNVLDITSWTDAKLVANWYKYGSNDPIQTLTLGKVKITGFEGSLAVQGRKEQTWSFKSDGDMTIEGFDVY